MLRWSSLKNMNGFRIRFPNWISSLGLCFLLLTGVFSAETTKSGIEDILKPKCENLLQNLTKGAWVSLTDESPVDNTRSYIRTQKSKLDGEMRKFWFRAGFPSNNFKSNNRCGFKRTHSVTRSSRKFAQWCDPTGLRPCCSNKQWGICVKSSSVYCDCPRCVDSRKYHHASLRQWQPDDVRCQWHNYTRDQACDVIEASPYDDIYYVGDSYARGMYLALLTILTGRKITGAWRSNMTQEELRLCSDSAFTSWKVCRQLSQSFDDLKFRKDLCRGRNITFRAQVKRYYNKRYAAEFLKLVNETLGKTGTLLLVSVGFHERYSATNVAGSFLEPAARLIRIHYANKPKNTRRWPEIKFMLPMRTSLLQPVNLLRSHGAANLARFEAEMRLYCSLSGIEVLDFQELGKNVHCFDGVHYDLTVNRMKNQILLNHIANYD